MFIGALDQGTTSTRFMIFDPAGMEVSRHQLEHRQILPAPGWVEHDPIEILERTDAAIVGALASAGLHGRNLAAIGVTNQRETTVVWNPKTGRPWHNAIVWQDTRTDAAARVLEPRRAELVTRTGLPPSTYFSALKLRWILDHVEGVEHAVSRGEAVFGTIDSWIIWHLTGGVDGGLHVTDATNASRTQLMNLRTLDWDEALVRLFHVPGEMLPGIHLSSDSSAFGTTRADGPVGAEVPITGVLGDQHAAMMGQACFVPGEAKNTYGTGNFMLLNTGAELVPSSAGLLTTLAYTLSGVRPSQSKGQTPGSGGSDPGTGRVRPQAGEGLTPVRGGSDPRVSYALEGSVAVTGSAVQWLRDQLGIIDSAGAVEALAASVPDSGGIYFVPAFSGLFAPYWRSDARGTIVGLARFHTRAHLARATLEAICFQTKAVLDAMVLDAGGHLAVLKVDGGATANNLLMQMQADVLGVPVVRPAVTETTALGAAYAAGLAVGFWPDLDTLRAQWRRDRQWEPHWSDDQRRTAYAGWQRAVDRSVGWME